MHSQETFCRFRLCDFIRYQISDSQNGFRSFFKFSHRSFSEEIFMGTIRRKKFAKKPYFESWAVKRHFDLQQNQNPNRLKPF